MNTFVNYNEIMEKQIMNFDGEKKRLLLQCCCAPCSSACLEKINDSFHITAYFYNPNITDYAEYIKRYDELLRFVKETYIERKDIDVVLPEHEKEKFYAMAKGLENEPEKGVRCYKCYELRMRKTAMFAKENGYDFFATTLSLSPHKNCQWINEIGERLAKEIGVGYLYSDFKKKNGYQRSIELSKEYGLYRQDYCGCEYSKKEKMDKENGSEE